MDTGFKRGGFLQEITQRAEARKAWEAEHPELTAMWNEAIEEDRQWVEAAEQKKAAEARARHVRAECPKRLMRLGAPERAVEAWEAGLQETEALKYVNAFLEAGKTFLVLAGGAGCGKTVAAVHAMAKRLLLDRREDVPALFMRASECARLGLYSDDDKRTTYQMHGASLLVVDDLGAEFMAEGGVWRGLMDELIDVRYGDRLPTILTTNLSVDAFKERYGERVADRIRHAGVVRGCGNVSRRARGEG